MESIVKNILSEVFDIPESDISGDMNLRDIESWDSLKHMNLIVLLEKEFKIEFSMEEIILLKSPAGIYNILNKREVKA